MIEQNHIIVSDSVKSALDGRKINEKETYNEVIERLLKLLKVYGESK